MTLHAKLVVACALGVRSAGIARSSSAAPPAPSETRLPNGLTVIVLEDHRLPIVSMRVVYRHEDASARGLHLVAPRLMLDGTEHVPTGQYDGLLLTAGGRDNTWAVTNDETYFAVTMPSSGVDLPLWLWSDQMAFLAPHLDAGMISRAASLSRQDKRMRVEEVSCGIAEQEMRVALYPPSHPYRVAPRTVPDDVDRTDVGTMQSYVARAYTPANAALVFVGDIMMADAVAHASKWFGDVPAPTRAAPAIDESLPVAESRIVARAHMDAARVRISWRIPADQDNPARWETLQQLLGGTETGLARWTLRDKLHLVTSVQSSYTQRAHGSVFTVNAVVAAGHDTREVVAGIDAFLRELVATAPPPSTIEWSRLEVVRRHLLGRETASERSAHLLEEWIAEGTATRPERRLDFDAATLIALVGFGLRTEHRAVIECVPDAAAPISGNVTSRTGGGFGGR